MNIEGKTALVTGGAKRIGRGITLALARAGANVVLSSLMDIYWIPANSNRIVKMCSPGSFLAAYRHFLFKNSFLSH